MIAASLRWAAHAYHASAEGRSFTDGTDGLLQFGTDSKTDSLARGAVTRRREAVSQALAPRTLSVLSRLLIVVHAPYGTRLHPTAPLSALILSIVTGTSPTRTCAQYGSPARPRARLYRFFVFIIHF